MSGVLSPEMNSTCDCPEGYDSDYLYPFDFDAGSVAPENSLSQVGRRPRSPSRGGILDPCSLTILSQGLPNIYGSQMKLG
jgi:hypothetical protein